ncbi:hypothetical protein DPMN_035500, partial [Dreissena polymorpha]
CLGRCNVAESNSSQMRNLVTLQTTDEYLQHQSPGIGQDEDRTMLLCLKVDQHQTICHRGPVRSPIRGTSPVTGPGTGPVTSHRPIPPVIRDRSDHRSILPVTGQYHRSLVIRDRSGHRLSINSDWSGHRSIPPVTRDQSGHRSILPVTGQYHRLSGTVPVTGHLSTVTGPVTGQYHRSLVTKDRSGHQAILPVTGQYYRSQFTVINRERDIDHHHRYIPPLLLLQRHLSRQLVLRIEVDVVHDLLYRVVLIHGVDMIDTDHLQTLGDVILGDVVPIEADLFLGIVRIKLVVMLHVDSVALTTLILHSTILSRIVRERRSLGLTNQIDLMLATILQLVCDWSDSVPEELHDLPSLNPRSVPNKQSSFNRPSVSQKSSVKKSARKNKSQPDKSYSKPFTGKGGPPAYQP